MNNRFSTSFFLLLSLFLSGCSESKNKAQDPLKELANNTGNYQLPSTANKINFPEAHAPKKAYRQEWWYLTANLTTEDGESLASQWTLFRRAVNDKHWYFAHAALADSSSHHSSYRNGREELGSVTIVNQPFSASIDDWSWQSSGQLLPAKLVYGSAVGSLSKAKQVNTKLSNHSSQWQVNLELSSKQPFFLQGEQGFSKKHHTESIASHYYSQPFIEVTGEVFWQGKWQKVTGHAWFDREWGSRMLADDQAGWDWFSLRLTPDKALMVYRLRSSEKDYIYASVMNKSGEITTLASDEVQVIAKAKSLFANSPYPTEFTLLIAKENIELNVQVINDQQIMRFGIEYFEGMVSFSGSHQGKGFVEMTGYPKVNN